MATWNMGQYDSIENDARRMDEIEYTRQRQDVLDKRAAQDYALRYESDKRKAAREKAELNQYMRTLPARQQLADMKLQNEINNLQTKQTEYDFKNRGYSPKKNAILRHLAQGDENTIEAARDLIKENNINLAFVPLYKKEMEAEEKAEQAKRLADLEYKQKESNYNLNNRVNEEKQAIIQQIQDQREYAQTNFKPLQKAVIKFRASGGDINALTKDEQILIAEYGQLDKKFNNYDNNDTGGITYFDYVRNSGDQYLRDLGIKPSFVQIYAEQQKKAAAEKAEAERKYAPVLAKAREAAAKAQEKEVYNNVNLEMTKVFNKTLNNNKLPPNIDKKKVIEFATKIYINAIKAGKNITPKQAFYEAAGIDPIPEQAEELYGAQYRDMSDKDKKKLEVMLTEFSAKQKAFEEQKYPHGSIKELNALRELEEYWRQMANEAGFGNWGDTYSDVKSPIFNKLHHADYAVHLKELREREKALDKKNPRFVDFVKRHPNVSGDEAKKYSIAIGDVPRSGFYINFLDLRDNLKRIQQLRNHLVELENRIKTNENRYTD